MKTNKIEPFENQANTVLIKISEMIYKVKKDEKQLFTGRCYVSHKEVIDTLNEDLKVVIIYVGECLFHKNF